MSKKKNPAAQALGRLGGRARANAQTPEQRRALAKLASRARWHKAKRKTR
jgi:hypothetical protein